MKLRHIIFDVETPKPQGRLGFLNEANGITYFLTDEVRKLSCKQVTGTITNTDLYVDGLIIRNNMSHTWQFVGGYVSLDANGAPASWNYYIQGHLGSTRMVVDGNGNIKDTINYYPFGSEMTMTTPSQITPNPNWQPNRFTGKELMRQNSLNMYDFGARWFDVAGVPMWTSIDPLAEKYYQLNPYMYCTGNPVKQSSSFTTFTFFIKAIWWFGRNYVTLHKEHRL